MPQPHRQACNLPLQLELGLMRAPTGPAALPTWTALPEATRQRLTELLTRLLVLHAGDGGVAVASARSDVDEH